MQYSFDAVSNSSSTALSFAGSDNYGNIWLDNVSVTDQGMAPVPEPGSLVLLAIGGIGIGAAATYRKRRGSTPKA